MFLVLATVLCLTRAEIIQRMRAPVVTKVQGMVKVYADCAEDQRREYQAPVARFAADTVNQLYRGYRLAPRRFRDGAIVIHIGDVRTNLTAVTARAYTNDSEVVTRIWLKAPAHADLDRFRLEVVKAFHRTVRAVELDDAAALAAYRASDPAFRIDDERRQLEDWLAGRLRDELDDEEALRMMRKIIEPGVASRRDVVTFASRLFLYPPYYDQTFLGKYKCLSFREAVKYAKQDPGIRIVAVFKARELPVMGGGRGEPMTAAAKAYASFLDELAKGEKEEKELYEMLDVADGMLSAAMEGAK